MKKLSKEHKKKLASAKKWRESVKGKKYLKSYIKSYVKGKKHTGTISKKLASARKWRASAGGKKYLKGYLGEYTQGFRRQRTPIVVPIRVRRLA